MARKNVFIIHGWGRQPEDAWADSYKATILKTLKQYKPFKGLTNKALEKDWIRIIPLNYDSVFAGYRERWQDLAGALADQPGIGNATVKKVIKWVAQSGDKTLERIFWDYILDALLWITLPEARMAVVAKVAAQVGRHYSRIFLEDGGQPSVSVIGYSMGTSVIHDTLVCLRKGEVTSANIDPATLQFVSVNMLANVGRLLQSPFPLGATVGQEDLKVYKSLLQPGVPGSLTSSYVNVRHRADPFTWPRHFDPDWAGGDLKERELVHYDDLKNVHNFDSYLENPKAHGVIFKRIFEDFTLFGAAETDAVRTKFQTKYNKTAGNEYNQFRALFQNDQESELTPLATVKFLLKVTKELA